MSPIKGETAMGDNMKFQLDTIHCTHDEILECDTKEEALQAVLDFHEIDELPEGWTITEIIEEIE